MANLGKLISDKASADAQWQERQKAEKERLSALRDACVTSSPQSPLHFVSACGENFARSLASPLPMRPAALGSHGPLIPSTSAPGSAGKTWAASSWTSRSTARPASSPVLLPGAATASPVSMIWPRPRAEVLPAPAGGRQPRDGEGSHRPAEAPPVQVVNGKELPTGANYDPQSLFKIF